VGAGGGTAVVLATAGDEVRLGAGHGLKVALTEPLTVGPRQPTPRCASPVTFLSGI